ncbi:MAG TPA: AgmX/PglI C-terminal domain-containing protein [Nannocystaceae bacterium]|nr:AgmX/PglI C-terminal domain-containing protein [Nannocystaceae bacterium]
MSSAGKSSGPRALRAAVVVDDKLYDEVHQSSPEPVTIGSAIANRFLVFGAGTPRAHKIFDVEDGAYVLDLPDGIKGEISIRGKSTSVSKLRRRQEGKSLRLRLDPSARGKLRLGECTLLFHFVDPAKVEPKPPFPPDLKPDPRAMFSSLDLATLGAVLMLLGPIFIYSSVKERDLTIEPEVDERFLRVMSIPPKKKEEKPPEEEEEDKLLALEEEDKVKEKDEIKVEKMLETNKKFSAEAVAKARGVGVLRALGTYGGEGEGTVFDVIQSTENNIGELFAMGMTKTISADGEDVSAYVPGGEGMSAAGAVVGTKGFEVSDDAPELEGLDKQERRIKSSVKASDADVLGDVDKRAVQATIRRRMSALQNCYNRALRTNPGLSGKMTYTIAISVMGAVTSVNVDEDTVRDPSVTSCTVAKIKGWRFPTEGAEEAAEVTFTVVFSGET